MQLNTHKIWLIGVERFDLRMDRSYSTNQYCGEVGVVAGDVIEIPCDPLVHSY